MRFSSLDFWVSSANILAAVVAAIALIYEMSRTTRERREAAKEEVKSRKLKVASDLVAYRFVLTANAAERSDFPIASASFNAAISRIPIDFIENEEVLRLYRSIGQNFTAATFHTLIEAILKDALGAVPIYFDVSLLENVPARNL